MKKFMIETSGSHLTDVNFARSAECSEVRNVIQRDLASGVVGDSHAEIERVSHRCVAHRTCSCHPVRNMALLSGSAEVGIEPSKPIVED
jgi:hypothetical protein